LNERFEQYINGKRENLHSNFTLRLKKILWEARSTPTLAVGFFLKTMHSLANKYMVNFGDSSVKMML
jgi:hypothetical protein